MAEVRDVVTWKPLIFQVSSLFLFKFSTIISFRYLLSSQINFVFNFRQVKKNLFSEKFILGFSRNSPVSNFDFTLLSADMREPLTGNERK